MKHPARARQGPTIRKRDIKKAVAMLNKRQRKKWDGLSSKQKADYIKLVQKDLLQEDFRNKKNRNSSNQKNRNPVSVTKEINKQSTKPLKYNIQKKQKLMEFRHLKRKKVRLENKILLHPKISTPHLTEFHISFQTAEANIEKKRKITNREDITEKRQIKNADKAAGILGRDQIQDRKKHHYVGKAKDIATILGVHLDHLIQKEQKEREEAERKHYIKSIFIEKLQMKSFSLAKNAGTKAGIALLHIIGKIVAAVASFLLPIFAVFGIVIVFLSLIVALLSFIFGASSSSGIYIGHAQVSAECEQYRPLVIKYCEKYDISEFQEIIMAVMMQESGGRYLDVMQSSECPYNTKYSHAPNSITDPEYSIECGVQAFKDALQTAGCTTPSDMDKLKLALQSYNYGSGYATWALTNYGGYSKENAILFSNMMAAKMGWNKYGDPDYVDHVLQYCIFTGGYSPEGIANQEAVGQLNMLSAKWPTMDERRGAVIAKGASLIGYTVYDMYGEDTRSGVDLPRTLDCSSFVAWAYQKCGFVDVPYWSTTGTFVSSSNFKQIDASELVPGDIGLINMIASGGNNHVGIYAGTDSNGTKMFLHCTSHLCAGSSMIDGPRISYYTAFQIFYRYTGFS